MRTAYRLSDSPPPPDEASGSDVELTVSRLAREGDSGSAPNDATPDQEVRPLSPLILILIVIVLLAVLGGAFVHNLLWLLLIVALAVLIWNLLAGRRGAV